MMTFRDTPVVNMLPDGRRMNLRHGPIDLIVEATGPQHEIEAAYRQAVEAFSIILEDLVSELDQLRKPVGQRVAGLSGDVAIKMQRAAKRVAKTAFATPMIAVAGAVADHVLEYMVAGRELSNAYVNNGGDIALYLAPQESFEIGVCANPLEGTIGSTAHIEETSDVRGIATSGWRGRSHSLGIADAVTVLAETAAIADAAATLIANAVDLPNHPAITRAPAEDLSPDSDLGQMLVTMNVEKISSQDAKRALKAGERFAQSLIDADQIVAAYGSLQAEKFAIGQNQQSVISLPIQTMSTHFLEAVDA